MFSALKNLVGSSEAPFNYIITEGEEAVSLGEHSIWMFNTGTAKNDGSKVSILSINLTSASEAQADAARNAVKRMKTLRHPNFVRFIDSVESPARIRIAMESVVPLSQFLEDSQNALAMSWGIHQIAKAVDFLVDRSMMHLNICMGSIFVDASGEWKLGGLELLRTDSDKEETLSELPTPLKYQPPETKGATSGRLLRRGHVWSADMWGFGCLIWEVFNGELMKPEKLKSVGEIPKSLLEPFIKLIGANPKSRPRASIFLEAAKAKGKYLHNDFVISMLFMEEVAIKSKEETNAFYATLPDMLDGFPRDACVFKFLPQLLHAFNFGGAGSAILAPLFKIGKMLSSEQYAAQILPCVVKLFSSTDRATRINLLKQLHHFSEHLSNTAVSNEIFPQVASGFSDSVPAMREQTVKAMLLLAPKLSETILDTQLLRYFAKLQMDEQPEIRTNTTICLGKIAGYLTPATRQRVLITAFARSMKDPFNHARTAGLMAFGATQAFFTAQDVALKMFPAVVPLILDPDDGVRKQAISLSKSLLERLENGKREADSTTHAVVSTSDSAYSRGWSWASSAFSAVTSVSLSKKAGGESAKKQDGGDNTNNDNDDNDKSDYNDDDDDAVNDDDDEFEDACDSVKRKSVKKVGLKKLPGGTRLSTSTKMLLKKKSNETESPKEKLTTRKSLSMQDDEEDDEKEKGWGGSDDDDKNDSEDSTDWGKDDDNNGKQTSPVKTKTPPRKTGGGGLKLNSSSKRAMSLSSVKVVDEDDDDDDDAISAWGADDDDDVMAEIEKQTPTKPVRKPLKVSSASGLSIEERRAQRKEQQRLRVQNKPTKPKKGLGGVKKGD